MRIWSTLFPSDSEYERKIKNMTLEGRYEKALSTGDINDVISCLSKGSPDITINSIGNSRRRPLQEAIRHPMLFTFLLEMGADPTLLDGNQHTVLHTLVSNGGFDLLIFFLYYERSNQLKTAKNPLGDTPYDRMYYKKQEQADFAQAEYQRCYVEEDQAYTDISCAKRTQASHQKNNFFLSAATHFYTAAQVIKDISKNDNLFHETNKHRVMPCFDRLIAKDLQRCIDAYSQIDFHQSCPLSNEEHERHQAIFQDSLAQCVALLRSQGNYSESKHYNDQGRGLLGQLGNWASIEFPCQSTLFGKSSQECEMTPLLRHRKHLERSPTPSL